MASELPPEQQASYSAIIDEILAVSDLNVISAKQIRKGLQAKVDYDITPQKAEITDLIMIRFDKLQREGEHNQPSTTAAVKPEPIEPAPTTNGVPKKAPKPEPNEDREVKSERSSPAKRKASIKDEDEDMSDVVDSPPPPKRVKKTKTTAETDEEIARRMQAELNAPGARSTRGAGTKKKPPVKKKDKPKTPKKKSKAKINSDDDSDVASGAEKPEREKKGGFHKPLALSEPLSAMLGEAALSRPQTVKKIWAYVRERDLQDPNDKRQIRCDEAMRAVFKQERVHMFTMNKLLAGHLYAVDE